MDAFETRIARASMHQDILKKTLGTPARPLRGGARVDMIGDIVEKLRWEMRHLNE